VTSCSQEGRPDDKFYHITGRHNSASSSILRLFRENSFFVSYEPLDYCRCFDTTGFKTWKYYTHAQPPIPMAKLSLCGRYLARSYATWVDLLADTNLFINVEHDAREKWKENFTKYIFLKEDTIAVHKKRPLIYISFNLWKVWRNRILKDVQTYRRRSNIV
jgi:hypothetical protein